MTITILRMTMMSATGINSYLIKSKHMHIHSKHTDAYMHPYTLTGLATIHNWNVAKLSIPKHPYHAFLNSVLWEWKIPNWFIEFWELVSCLNLFSFFLQSNQRHMHIRKKNNPTHFWRILVKSLGTSSGTSRAMAKMVGAVAMAGCGPWAKVVKLCLN